MLADALSKNTAMKGNAATLSSTYDERRVCAHTRRHNSHDDEMYSPTFPTAMRSNPLRHPFIGSSMWLLAIPNTSRLVLLGDVSRRLFKPAVSLLSIPPILLFEVFNRPSRRRCGTHRLETLRLDVFAHHIR